MTWRVNQLSEYRLEVSKENKAVTLSICVHQTHLLPLSTDVTLFQVVNIFFDFCGASRASLAGSCTLQGEH